MDDGFSPNFLLQKIQSEWLVVPRSEKSTGGLKFQVVASKDFRLRTKKRAIPIVGMALTVYVVLVAGSRLSLCPAARVLLIPIFATF